MNRSLFEVKVKMSDLSKAIKVLNRESELKNMFTVVEANTIQVIQTPSQEDNGEIWNQIMEILENNEIELEYS